MVFVPNYDSGLAALGKGVDSIGKAFEGYQRSQGLSMLGQQIADKDFDAATKTAFALGSPETALSIAKLGQSADSTKAFNDAITGLSVNGGLNSTTASTTPTASASASDASENLNPARYAAAYFQNKGLPAHSAAALAGGFQTESKFNPGANNPGDGTDGSDSGGIGQWNSDRAVALQNFAAANKLDPLKVPTQLAFAWNELQGNEKPTLDRLMAARGIDDANAAAVGYFRPAGWTAANPTAARDYSTRVANTQKLFGGSPGVQVASNDPTFMPQALGYASQDDSGTPLPPPRPTSLGGAPGNPDVPAASTAIARASQDEDDRSIDPNTTAVAPGDVKATALQSHLAATPDGSATRIAKLAKVLALPGLSEGQQKVASAFLQRELDSQKLPDAVKQYLFAKSQQGGGFEGSFADFQKKSQDRGDTIESATNMRAKLAPQYGLQTGTPEHRDFVLTGNLPNRGGSIEGQVTERTKLAPQLGLQQGSPAWQAYVANGKLPDQSPDGTPEMRASEQKMFAGTQEKARVLDSQIRDLNRALELNGQAYSGNYEPGAAQWAGRNLPFNAFGMVDPKRVEATTEFNNLVGGATLSQGKELFGGRITNYDEKLMQDLKARPDMTPGEREVILRSQLDKRMQLRDETMQDIADMRSGSRFQKGSNVGQPPHGGAPAMPPSQAAPAQRVAVPSAGTGGGSNIPAQQSGTISAPRQILPNISSGGLSTPQPTGQSMPTRQPVQAATNAPRQAPDGNWYVGDPSRPGKYLQVVP